MSDKEANPALSPYLGGVASWFIAFGLHSVMVPTLAAIYLDIGAAALGVLQMTLGLPQLVLLLYAGSLADKSDGRKVLMIVHCLAVLPPALVWLLIRLDMLSYWHLLAYGSSIGVLFAFAGPTRDALLLRVVQKDAQRHIMRAIIIQNIAQLCGFGLAVLVAPSGATSLPILQIAALLVGLFLAARLPCYPPTKQQSTDGRALDWTSGVRAVMASGQLYSVLLGNLAVGLLFVGFFMTGLPIMVRDIFAGGQAEIGTVFFIFWGGASLSTFLLMRARPIHYRGRALCLSLFAGASAMLSLPHAPSFPIFCLLIAGWGLAAGVNIAMSRTIAQLEAPAHSRARVMALYNLGFIGAAPLGALAFGLLVEWVGIGTAPTLCALTMLGFALWFTLATPARHITRRADEN